MLTNTTNNMAKTTIADLKARFKRGMFPTEGDFANVFDSYVHKDDGIDIENVTTGNGSKTLTVLLQEIKEATVTEAVEAAKNEFPEIPELPEGLAEFIAKVNSFLEDADASDATINKWKEIESFLTGITDTETLTGLLADLKQEILDEIPEQKEYTAGDGIDISEDGVISLKEDEIKPDCVKVIADLDASTAPKGTVAIYTGATNDKYTHGFIYEKMGEGGGLVPSGENVSSKYWSKETVNGVSYLLPSTKVRKSNLYLVFDNDRQYFALKVDASLGINGLTARDGYCYSKIGYDKKLNQYENTVGYDCFCNSQVMSGSQGTALSFLVFRESDHKAFDVQTIGFIYCMIPIRSDGRYDFDQMIVGEASGESYSGDLSFEYMIDSDKIHTTSWIPLNVMNVIG